MARLSKATLGLASIIVMSMMGSARADSVRLSNDLTITKSFSGGTTLTSVPLLTESEVGNGISFSSPTGGALSVVPFGKLNPEFLSGGIRKNKIAVPKPTLIGAVPEPASLLLLGSGLAGAAALLRRKRRTL